MGLWPVSGPSSDLADGLPFRGTGKVVLRYAGDRTGAGVVLHSFALDLGARVLLRLAA